MWPSAPKLAIRWPKWLVIVTLWTAATVLSALQIHFREAARGAGAPWVEVLAANVLAWIPWLAIAPAALWLERRFPIPGSRWGRHLLVHLGAAVAISCVYLFYLAYFHAAYLEGGGLIPSWRALRLEYVEKLGQHFLVAVMLYAAIVLVGFGHRSWSNSVEHRADDKTALDRGSFAPLIVRSVGEMERVDPLSVEYIESCGNYSRLHIGERGVLIRRTLTSLAEELAPAGFVRIHRSGIVNLDRVSKLRTGSHGDAAVELDSGRLVKVSRTYRRSLEEQVL